MFLFCWSKGKDGIRSSHRVCGEEGSPGNGHQGEEPLHHALSGPPAGLPAAAAGHHRGGPAAPGRHELQRVRWLPDRPAQQGRVFLNAPLSVGGQVQCLLEVFF